MRINRICQNCGKEFVAKTSLTKCCGDPCAKQFYKARKRAEKIQVSDQETTAIRAKPIEALKAKDFLSVEEAGTMLGISRRTLYRLMDKGRIPYTKLGRRTIIARMNIDQLFI